MDFWVLFILRVSLMAIPLYVCNGLALLLGGKTRVDFGKNFFDGRPILGEGKTLRGSIAGIAFGFLAVALLHTVFPQTDVLIGINYVFFGTLLAVGAVLGDFAGSFVKRRSNIKRGESVLFLDQLDFVLGGFLTASILMFPSMLEIVFLLGFTMIAHVVGNHLAFFSRLKRVPW